MSNSNLQKNKINLQNILNTINDLPEASSGVELPTLSNEAVAAELFVGKELINQEGEIVTGTMPDNGAVNATMDGIDTKTITIAAGYTSGGTVSLDNTIDNAVSEQADLIAQIMAEVNSLPEAGSPETRPTLFAPTIALNSVSSELTITDTRNGYFVPWYDLYVNGEFVTTLTSKTATLTDYIEHTETVDVKVQAKLTNFNPSESNVVEWIKIAETDGTLGLAYELSSDGTYATCIGRGEAVELDIKVASSYDGVPVRQIKSNAFTNYITSLVIPDTVTSIGDETCLYNKYLTSVVIGNSVTKIPYRNFDGCSSLVSVVIGSSVVEIDYRTFYGCTKLPSMVMPPSVTKIGTQTFYGCDKLKRLDFSAHTKIPAIQSNSFTYTFENLQFKVPANLVDEWKAATNWAALADKIVTEFTNEI